MTKEALIQHLATHDRYAYEEQGDGSLIVADKVCDPPVVTRLTPEAIERHDLAFLITALAGGRDVEHITRVTGYFSKVSGWNKSKQAELRDRHRVRV